MNTIRIPARELQPGDRVLVGHLSDHVQVVTNVFQSVSTWIRYADRSDATVGHGPHHVIAPDEYLTIIADD